MQIKFVDLAAQNEEIRERVERELARDSSRMPATSAVRRSRPSKKSSQLFSACATSSQSATAPTRSAWRCSRSDVGPGDEVITTPMTFIATAASIRQTGARPTLVDVDPETCNIDPARAAPLPGGAAPPLAARLRAILPVHLYGLPAAMRELQEIALEFGLRIVEDACQAHGASFHDGQRWRYAGTIGAAGCFSFYPGQEPRRMGRRRRGRDRRRRTGGADQNAARPRTHLALRASGLRLQRAPRRDPGGGAARQARAARTTGTGAGASSPRPIANCSTDADAGAARRARGVRVGLSSVRHSQPSARRDPAGAAEQEYRVRHPLSACPLHLQPACRDLGYRPKDFPVSERIADTELSLPMHPHLTDAEVRQGGRGRARGRAQASDPIRRRASPKPSRLCSPPGGGE